MVNLNEINKKPIINYPTLWAYKVIFDAKENAQAIFKKLFKEREFSFKHSNESKNGKYQSYELHIFVDSEKDRLNIFFQLKKRAKFVL